MTRGDAASAAGGVLRLVFLLLGVSFITFALMEMAPGDPAEIRLTSQFETPSPDAVAALRRQMGLDDPFPIRYGRWLGRIARLDLGRSLRTGDPVSRELGRRIPATLGLAAATLAFTVVFSMAAGILAALREGRLLDRLIQVGTTAAVAVPDYWLAMLLVYAFAVKLAWLPSMGGGGAASLVLPVTTLGLSLAAVHGRVFRASLLAVLKADYVRFARIKGLPTAVVIGRHALRNALLPVLTLWGVSLGHLLGGTAIVETVFALPGVGKLTVDAVLERDFPMVQGGVLFMATAFILVSRLVDALYRILDPRIRETGGT